MKRKTVILSLLICVCGLCFGNSPRKAVFNESVQPYFAEPSGERYTVLFADEFDGNSLNWKDWASESPAVIKHETSRGPESVEVKDGELRLNIKYVGKSEKLKWTAGYVYLKEPLQHNTYIECRFRSGQSGGVNNAFWLASKSGRMTPYSNHYEVDIVEARKNVKKGTGDAHLAWHDWKTSSYTKNASGKLVDIAQGIKIDHDFAEYHTWGFWYGENEFIWYLDGKEMWRGTSHRSYKDQYCTGVGKVPVWYTDEEQRAYGRYGQDDWCYLAGYNGDALHVILANIAWGESWTPLVKEEADGTYMAVDYVRIFKPESYLNCIADQQSSPVGKFVELDSPVDLSTDGNYYFGATFKKKKGETLDIIFEDERHNRIASCEVGADGGLGTGFSRHVSSRDAESPFKDGSFVKDGKEMTLICRFTASSDRKDAISVWTAGKKEICSADEPYFYPNVDDNGNTSMTQEWYVNHKEYVDSSIRYVRFESSRGPATPFVSFKAGKSFNSVK